MTADRRGVRPRIAVDRNVLMEAEALRRVLLATDLGLIAPIWSSQVVGELASAGLWRLGGRAAGHRSIATGQHAAYRHRLSERIDAIDQRFEIMLSPPAAPIEEVAWADAGDRDELHVQRLARTARADCVISWNHRDFPGRRVVRGRPCGELCGVLWITPDQLPSLGMAAAGVTP